LPGYEFAGGGLTNAIPDGDDLLMPMESGARWHGSRSGLLRWQRSGGRWRPVEFQPITESDDSIEASVIRDLDGEFLFCARTQNPGLRDVHPIRVWKSRNQGRDWQLVLFAGGISSAPVTINQAADGAAYIAANRYTYAAHMNQGVPSIEYFRGPDGKIRSDKGTRETLALWPLNEARNGLKPPLLIRDGLVELGPPPNGTWWGIDHPSAMTVHLGDGRWHNVIGYRLYEKAEMTDFVAPTEHTGAYLEEVISAGKPIPLWNF